ncbi:hypothetical protein D9M68_971890 [compost metagenome]
MPQQCQRADMRAGYYHEQGFIGHRKHDRPRAQPMGAGDHDAAQVVGDVAGQVFPELGRCQDRRGRGEARGLA